MCVCGHLFKTKIAVYSTRKSKGIAIQKKGALESADETLSRQVKDSTKRARNRALETDDETLHRQEQDRAYCQKESIRNSDRNCSKTRAKLNMCG